jgi:hypothetical protein
MVTTTQFFFNHVITRFGALKQFVSDHGWYFGEERWNELASILGIEHQYSSSYYLQGNGQVDVINRVLKTMLQWIMNKHKTNLHHISSLHYGIIWYQLRLVHDSLIFISSMVKR